MTCVSEISGNASIGVCHIAQSPTTENAETSRKTMKRFLALNSMICATLGVQSFIFMPGIPAIPLTAAFNWLSESIKKFADVMM